MSESDTVRLERDGPVAVLRLCRPEKRNALSPREHLRIQALCEELREDFDTRVVLLTGEGQAQSLGLKAGDVLYAANGERLTDREALRAALEAAGDQPLRVTVRRFMRDAAGKPQPAADMEGLLFLDEAGLTRWDYTEFEVELSPGRIGARIGEEQMLPKPAR